MPTDTGLEVRLLQPGDAPQLVDCFERCYGDTYVADTFYDADKIGAQITSGRLRSVVAVADGDGIVGHMALTIRHPQALTVDAGNTVVDPRYRGHNLAARMAAQLVEVCRECGLVGFHHYPTTAHPVMQKLAVQGGGIETGIMLGYIPAGTDYRELSSASSDRLAVVIVYQPIDQAPPRQVFVPARYRALLQSLYAGANLERAIAAPAPALPSGAAQIDSHFDTRRGLLRVDVQRCGPTLPELVAVSVAAQPAQVIQVDLRLDDAGVEDAVERLRRSGFFLAGLLPEYTLGDVLRLQFLPAASAETLAPRLATSGGQLLLQAISADRRGQPAGAQRG